MKYKHLALTLGIVIISTLILLISCKKINEATTLGGDLIPPVDNINTFDTSLDVEAYNDTFSLVNDTTYYSSSYEHFLGQITNDPIFGKTDAKVYLELKPSVYPFTFSSRPDSLHIDSVVLIMDYLETFGDTSLPQTVNVFEIAQSSDFGDTTYQVRKSNFETTGPSLGTVTVKPENLKDSVKVYQDTTSHQLRIRLSDAFGQRLLAYDTSEVNGHTNAYTSDSVFRRAFKGFALEATGGNSLMGFNLSGPNTKLAIYYKDDNNDAPVANWDTAVTYFTFAGNTSSASANYVKRDYTGTPLAAAIGGTTPDDMVYIQGTPGSFATLKIPGLSGLSNRVVHRAELVMEQVYDSQDSIFPPSNLYLDAYNPATSSYQSIPYDFLLDASFAPNLAAFGSAAIPAADASGNPINIWRFNLTRYVQHIVTGTESVYDLRLFAPFYTYENYKPSAASTSSVQVFYINGAVGAGRVRLGGYQHPTQKMRLRIVYSKI